LNHNGTHLFLKGRPALVLWLFTLCLWLPWLGNLPLRDWDEALIASISHSTMGQDGFDRLLPIRWDGIYLNKPPGLHWLIGAMSQSFGRAEWALRLVPALLSTLAVPLLVLLRQELAEACGKGSDGKRHGQRSAWLAGLILMTLLPMARQGRLVMLDGMQLSCMLLIWWGWLRSGREPWIGLLAGLGGSGVLLSKPPALLGFLVITVAIGVAENQLIHKGESSSKATMPWSSRFSWVLLGFVPGLSWHAWNFSQRGDHAWHMWGAQGLARVTTVLGDKSGAWLMPLTEVLEGGWPWLLLLPSGVIWAWRHRHSRVGCWELGLLIGCSAMVLPLKTQLPWYSHLLWPPIALLCAESLNELLEQQRHRWIASCWAGVGAILILAALLLQFKVIAISVPPSPPVLAGAGLLIGGIALQSTSKAKRRQGFSVLLCGWSLGLLLLWQSGSWLWELNETWDPRPIAAQIRSLPASALVLREGNEHPALDWYSERRIGRISKSSLPQGDFWLISNRFQKRCQVLDAGKPLASRNWGLWFCPARETRSTVAPMPTP